MAGGKPDYSEAARDAEAWGIPAELVAMQEEEEPGFPVWPDNMPIVEAFLSVTSQFVAISLSHGGLLWRGFDYAGVRAGLEGAGLKLLPHQWTGLRLMETTATSALNGYRG